MLSYNVLPQLSYSPDRRRRRVVRTSWSWCRKLPERSMFKAGLHHPTTEKLSLSKQQEMGVFFRIREV